jgi:hypothetical protein
MATTSITNTSIVPTLAIIEQPSSISPRQDTSHREAINNLGAAAQLLDKLKMRRKSSPRGGSVGTPGRRSGANSSRIGQSPRDVLSTTRDSDFIPSDPSTAEPATPIKIISMVENACITSSPNSQAVPESPYVGVSVDGPFYRYDDLVMNAVKDINMAHKEMYLDNPTFVATFGLSRSEFAAYPKWKRDLKKREVGLF